MISKLLKYQSMKKNQLQITNLKMLLLITVMLLSVSWAQAVNYYVKDAAPNVLSNWGTNTDGTGTAPDDFTTRGDVFIIPNGRNVTTNGIWTIGTTDNGRTWELRVEGTLNVANTISMQARTNGIGSTVTLNVNGANGKIVLANSGVISALGNGVVDPIFNLNSGSTLVTSNINGITGTSASINLTNLTANLSTSANYEFNGTANQATTGMPATVNNLTINNSAGVTLSATTTVSGNLTQTSGNIAVGSNTLTVNGTHNAGTNTVTGTGTYTLSSGATLITANLAGISTSGATGTIQTTTRNYNTAANYRFNGAADQVTGNGLPATVTSFRVQNTGGIVTLSNSSLSATTLTIDAGAKLTVNSGQTLSATTLNISSDATNGTGTFVNGGTATFTTANVTQSLVDANNTINVNRNWYLSAPIATSGTLPSGFTYYYYPESDTNQGTNSGEYWLNPASTTEMMGYAVTAAPANSSVTFSGTLNDGSKSIALTRTAGNPKTGFNLVGNPYPSYLTLSTSDVTGANLEQYSVWYRYVQSYNTETNKPVYAFQTQSFGVSAIKVPPMQSFWVRTNTGGGTLQFANTQRSHAASGDPVFRAKAADGPQLLELFVTNGSNYDNTVIYFDSNFSDGLDPYDAYKMLNGSIVPDLYTTVNSSKLAYNSLSAIPYDTEISLFFTPNASTLTSYTISASKFSNFEAGTQVWIKNNQSGLSQLISDGSSFTFDVSQTGTNPKFSLILKAPGTTTELAKTEKSNIFVFANENRQITVNCNDAISSDAIVTVYNNVGQRVTSGKITKNRTVIEQPVTSGVYVVTVLNAGKTTAAKIIIQ